MGRMMADGVADAQGDDAVFADEQVADDLPGDQPVDERVDPGVDVLPEERPLQAVRPACRRRRRRRTCRARSRAPPAAVGRPSAGSCTIWLSRSVRRCRFASEKRSYWDRMRSD